MLLIEIQLWSLICACSADQSNWPRPVCWTWSLLVPAAHGRWCRSVQFVLAVPLISYMAHLMALIWSQCHMLPVLTYARSMPSGYHHHTVLLGQIKQMLISLVTTIEQWHRDWLCSYSILRSFQWFPCLKYASAVVLFVWPNLHVHVIVSARLFGCSLLYVVVIFPSVHFHCMYRL